MPRPIQFSLRTMLAAFVVVGMLCVAWPLLSGFRSPSFGYVALGTLGVALCWVSTSDKLGPILGRLVMAAGIAAAGTAALSFVMPTVQ